MAHTGHAEVCDNYPALWVARADHAEVSGHYLAVWVVRTGLVEVFEHYLAVRVVRSGHTHTWKCLGFWAARTGHVGRCLGICPMDEWIPGFLPVLLSIGC